MLWPDALSGKLERLPLMQEAGGPKILLYESHNDGLLDYDEIKKRRVNIFTGVGCGVSSQKVGEVMDIWDVVKSSCAPDQRDRSCLAILVKLGNLKAKSALDVIRPKLPKKTPTAVVTLDPDQPDLLSRIRRGKRAFGFLAALCAIVWNDVMFELICKHWVSCLDMSIC